MAWIQERRVTSWPSVHICMYTVQVTSLTEKLQAKESAPEEQTAASGTAQAGAAEATPAIQLKQGYAACAGTNAGNGAAGVLAGFAGGSNDDKRCPDE